jgi:hypothetical protein
MRRAYGRAVVEFLAWCDENGVPSISAVQPLHVAAWIEQQTRTHCSLDRQAALGRLAPPVRLAGDWPGGACESGRITRSIRRTR